MSDEPEEIVGKLSASPVVETDPDQNENASSEKVSVKEEGPVPVEKERKDEVESVVHKEGDDAEGDTGAELMAPEVCLR